MMASNRSQVALKALPELCDTIVDQKSSDFPFYLVVIRGE